jgi:hypothetical protein
VPRRTPAIHGGMAGRIGIVVLLALAGGFALLQSRGSEGAGPSLSRQTVRGCVTS